MMKCLNLQTILIIGIAKVLFAAAMVGCASARLGGGVDRTGGLAVELEMRGDDDSAAFYRLTRSGQLEFAGGRDANQKRISWTGQLDEDDIASVRELLETHGWLSGEASRRLERSVPDSAVKRRYDLTVRQGRETRRYQVIGPDSAMTELYDQLDRLAARRFDSVLDQLPRAGDQQ
ncbi:MAG: hypothetical protein EA377_06080 [Phycisphaerales bacterium]|nr:MAG: hypothetical protein EA377_06080 [Phycisphaerales bacterium]